MERQNKAILGNGGLDQDGGRDEKDMDLDLFCR